MKYEDIRTAAEGERLEILGGFNSAIDDDLPAGAKSILLLGPREPGFWAHVKRQPEFVDGGANPLDRWSLRVIGGLAGSLLGTALFPFGGPPYNPFFDWALRTGRCWQSPVKLLVHDRCGLFVSFRGALAFRRRLDIPPPPARSPCTICIGQPCMRACPVDALDQDGFDAQACRDYIGDTIGRDCLNKGCNVRRVCPAGQDYTRSEAQSRFHQIAFLNG